MRLSLIKCAVNCHDFGRTLHDDTLDRWIHICRRCGLTVKVDVPRDENGMKYTPFEWLKLENERSAKELGELVEKYKKGL